jgi:hypothetical protein
VTHYFYVHFEEEDSLGIGYVKENVSFDLISNIDVIHNWKPINILLKNGKNADYLANDLGWRICSPKLRDILDGGQGRKDILQWLPVYVEDTEQQSEFEYFVLIFPNNDDVIDREKSILAGKDSVVQAVLDMNKTSGHSVFSLPGEVTTLIVSKSVREAIENAHCTGIEFSTVRMSV